MNLIIYKNLKFTMKLDELDPDWEFAKNHGKASKVGIPLKGSQSGESTMICRCCHRYINKKPIPLCQSIKELSFIGFGFPLYYIFLSDCIVLLLLSLCSYNAVALYRAIHYNQTYCETLAGASRLLESTATEGHGKCWTFMVKMATIEPDVPPQEQVARIVSWVLQFFWLMYMRRKLSKIESFYDQRTTTLSDYSIIMKGLPLQNGIQAKVKQFFLKQFDQRYEVKQLTLLQDANHFQQLKQKKKHIVNKMRKYYKKQNFENEQFIDLRAELNDVNEKLDNRVNFLKELADKDQIQTQKVILVFETEPIKNDVIQKFKVMRNDERGKETIKEYFGIGCCNPIIHEAPEPSEIYWNNINVSWKKRVMLTIISYAISAAILAILTVIVYFIFHAKSRIIIDSYTKLEHDPNNQKYIDNVHGAIAIVYVILVLIMLFNKLVMSQFFHKMTDIEKNETGSQFQLSFEIKYCLGLFFTTAVMTLIVEGAEEKNYYTHIYGVIDEESVMFFFVLGFIPIFWIVNPVQLWRLLTRKIYYGARHLTQKQANHLMEDSEYEMGKRYAEIIEIVWFTFLYATLIPFGAFASFLGLIFIYIIDKFNLLRRSSVTHDVSGKLVQGSLTLLDISLIMKPTGELVFDNYVRHVSFKIANISSIVCIIIGALYVLLPAKKMLEAIDQENFHQETRPYSEMKKTFKDTYHTCHPVYSWLHEEKISKRYQDSGIYLNSQDSQKQLKAPLQTPFTM